MSDGPIANRLGVGVGPRKAAPLGIPGSVFPWLPKPLPFLSRTIPDGVRGSLPTLSPGSGPDGGGAWGESGPTLAKPLLGVFASPHPDFCEVGYLLYM